MKFKPTTYLASFAGFVILFMGLGGYVGYVKIAEHLLVISYLEALPINARVQAGPQGNVLCWEDKVPQPRGAFVSITADNRSLPLAILYSDEPRLSAQPASRGAVLSMATNEHAEDLRIDQAGRYLFPRVLATSNIPSKETTWLYKYDLQRRKWLRRTSVNPILLPTPFRP
ncbi:MAG TPA: hypothetical protein VF378_09890 [Geothrix sp.]